MKIWNKFGGRFYEKMGVDFMGKLGGNVNPKRVKLVAYFRIMACACGKLYKPLTFRGFIGLSETSAIVTV